MQAKPTTIIHVARPGQPSQQLSVEEVNQRLASGQLDPLDRAWQDGLPDWVPLARIRGVKVSSPARPAPAAQSPKSVWGTIYDQSTIPTLWNPLVCGLWSLLFTPIFGATLVARNWRVLGRIYEARASRVWVWVSLVLLVAPPVLFACQVRLVALLAGVGLFLLSAAWFVTGCLGQMRVVRVELNYEFFRARWTKPVLLATVCLAAYIGVFFLVALV